MTRNGLVLAAILVVVTPVEGVTVLGFYTLDIGGRVHRINPETGGALGSFTIVGPRRQWNDIAATPLDPGGVYVVSLETGTSERNLTRVELATGQWEDIPLTNASGDLHPFEYAPHAITFNPNRPHLGYMGVSSLAVGGGQLHRLARFNMVTRRFETSVATAHRWTALAMNDQSELIGSVDFFDESHGELTNVYNINPRTGASSLRFTVNSRDVTGLAYHPDDERLFAVDAFTNDDLVILDPDTGAIDVVVGDLPSAGPNGVTFATGLEAPGDYNRDGLVDTSDYTVWRDTLGDAVSIADGADGSGDGVVNAADYVVWRSNFGERASASATAHIAAPAPSGAALLAIALIDAARRSNRKHWQSHAKAQRREGELRAFAK